MRSLQQTTAGETPHRETAACRCGQVRRMPRRDPKKFGSSLEYSEDSPYLRCFGRGGWEDSPLRKEPDRTGHFLTRRLLSMARHRRKLEVELLESRIAPVGQLDAAFGVQGVVVTDASP